MNTERDQFEQAVVAHSAAQRAAGLAIDDNGAPLTVESLCWKDEQGNYGVKMFNAAWWGWRTRAALAELRDGGLELPDLEYWLTGDVRDITELTKKAVLDYGDRRAAQAEQLGREKALAELRDGGVETPEIAQRVLRAAGKTLRTVRNPSITARECIELANWILNYGDRRAAAMVPQWLPIESAPKDGTEVLLWPGIRAKVDGAVPCAVGKWVTERSTNKGLWYDLGVGHHNGFWHPTHWMPLPAAPKEAL